MNNVQVGEYVRTKDGFIAKCTENNGITLEFDNYVRITFGEYWDFLYSSHNDIIKHSFNIIDVISEGDYVNGYFISEKEENKLITNFEMRYDKLTFSINEIKSVITKEQIEKFTYKL